MDVTVYSTSTCGICHALMDWLSKQGVAYKEVVTDTDPEHMVEFMEVNDGMIGVPFTVIKAEDGTETKISGFDQGKFKQALGL